LLLRRPGPGLYEAALRLGFVLLALALDLVAVGCWRNAPVVLVNAPTLFSSSDTLPSAVVVLLGWLSSSIVVALLLFG